MVPGMRPFAHRRDRGRIVATGSAAQVNHQKAPTASVAIDARDQVAVLKARVAEIDEGLAGPRQAQERSADGHGLLRQQEVRVAKDLAL